MKTFRNFLNENAGLSSEPIPHDIDDIDVKNKVNAILHVQFHRYTDQQASNILHHQN